jgi:hypothetical protein
VSIKSAACAVVMCLAASAALAQPVPLPAAPVAGLGPIMPPQEVARILRANGFVPQATPVRNGEAYQVRAIDPRGRQVRVAIDARYGDLLMVRPIVMVPPGVYGPRPYGPPPHYFDGDLPTGAVSAYPPPGRTATLAPAHPPIPRPKPAAKPAAVAPAPAATPEAKPAPAASPAATTAAAAPVAAAAPAPSAAAAPAALPPVTPLE